MKKNLLAACALVCVLLIGIYFFIPANIEFSKFILIKTNLPAANRFLSDESKWDKWFSPGSSQKMQNKTGDTSFWFKDYHYSVENAMMNTVEVLISNDVKSINSLVSVISKSKDSVAVEWKAGIDAGINPFKRIISFFEAKELRGDMGEILGDLKAFLEKDENIYGINITQQQVVDTILFSTKNISNTLPATEEIYSLINKLRKYISNEGARETNPPMLNITGNDSAYRTMVAIPIDKIIPEKNDYVFKRMIPGKILVAEVKGGDYTARQALKQLELYISDHQLSSPAIPFESLITERQQEPDTTKWVTKIYYPIY